MVSNPHTGVYTFLPSDTPIDKEKACRDSRELREVLEKARIKLGMAPLEKIETFQKR